MDCGVDISCIQTALNDFQCGKRIRRKSLTPLPKSSNSREKELNDVYCQIQSEIKQIKDGVLSNLADGGAVDYDKIKSLFEKSELEIQEKKKDILLQFNSKPAIIPTSHFTTGNNKYYSNNSQFNLFSITKDEKPVATEVQTEGSRKKSMKQERSFSSSAVQKHFDVQKLKNIINPAQKDATSSLNKQVIPKIGGDMDMEDKSYSRSSARSRIKPITGSTISHPHLDSLSPAGITPTPPTYDDARKGILSLIQRKMIPAASSLTIVPSPIKKQKIVLHDPSNKSLNKQEPRSQYSLALVKFDKSTLDDGLGVSFDRSRPDDIIIEESSLPNHRQESAHQDFMEFHKSDDNMGYQLSSLKAFFPSSAMTADSPSHKFIIQNGKSSVESQDFIHFKQYYCLSWESIAQLLDKLEKLMVDYSVPIAFIDGDRLADMSLYFEIGPKPTMKDLLMCVLNSLDVEKIICIPGRRFLATDGEDMAAIQIQAMWRGCHQWKVYREERRRKAAAGLIALNWIMRCKQRYVKKHLQLKNCEYLSNSRLRFKAFKEQWPKIKDSRRVIIHVPSLGYPVDIRKSLPNIATLQNCQMGRICDIKDPNVEVIYICPLEMDAELHEYYKRLLEIICMVSGQDYQNVAGRLKMLTPENLNKFSPHNLCLSSLLKYSEYLLQRVQNLIKGKEAYIVPGVMQYDDLYVADKLGIPILGCEPDIAHLYSLKSGVHRIFESAGVRRAPSDFDIYSQEQFDESLAKLVTQNLHIKRWLFKIDNNFDGRGTAYCDIIPYLTCYDQAIKEADRYGEEWRERWAHQNVYNAVLKELPKILERYGTPVDKTVFRNWQEFMCGFIVEGGIIEACPPADSVTGITGNVLIEPNGVIQILSVADQIHSTSPYKCWGYTVPQSSFDVGILNKCILSISNACKSRGIVGYISIDFITFIDPISDNQELWAVGLKLAYSNSHAMIHMMTSLADAKMNVEKNKMEVIVHKTPQKQAAYVSRSKRANQIKEKLSVRKQRFAVVTPNMLHSNLNNIVYNVFFQICRAHGIAYDEKMKIGTAFTLMSNINRDLMGMITIAESLHDAVSMFSLNLVTIHNDVSTPIMTGRSNFQGALDDLKGILEALRINLEIDQNKYPTMDPKDRRQVQSASSRRSAKNGTNKRPKSAGEKYDDKNIDDDYSNMMQFSNTLAIDVSCRK